MSTEIRNQDSIFEKQERLLLLERKANTPLRKLLRNKSAVVGLLIVLIVFFVAVFAPLLATHDPYDMDFMNVKAKPGLDGHLLGCDELGRDLFSRIIYGARIALFVSLGGMFLGAFFGILIGLIAGYYGGRVDTVLMRIMDGMFAFPFTLLALLLLTSLGEGLSNVILAIGIANIPGYARLIRGQVHNVKNEDYITAIRSLGSKDGNIIFRHILPNTINEVLVYMTLNVGNAILTEASLSFLGMGIIPPMPSWGGILKASQAHLVDAPHIAIFSGLMILFTVLGFNLLGDGIRDVLDPTLNR